MLIAKVTDGAVVSVADYRSLFPNTSFPKGPTAQFLHENGCMKVSAFVDHDSATQMLQPCQPYIQGNMVYTVQAVDKTAEQLAAEVAAKEAKQRKRRDELLAETDWVVIFHTEKGTNIPLEWEVYRQALRDITAHPNWPDLQESDINGQGGDWPVKP